MNKSIGYIIVAVIIFVVVICTLFIISMIAFPKLMFNPFYYLAITSIFGSLVSFCCWYFNRKQKNKIQKFYEMHPADIEGLNSVLDKTMPSHNIADISGNIKFDNKGNCYIETEKDKSGISEPIKLDTNTPNANVRVYTPTYKSEMDKKETPDDIKKIFTQGIPVYAVGDLYFDGAKFILTNSEYTGLPLWISTSPKDVALPEIREIYSPASSKKLARIGGFLSVILLILGIFLCTLIDL